jgi:hypothetical protein
MIIRWRKRDASTYVAAWQGMSLELHYEPVKAQWYAVVDGAKCKGRWYTPLAAIDAVDLALGRQIAKLGNEVHARQGRPSGAPLIVHHGGAHA